MARVKDLWTKRNPDKNSQIKRVKTKRWGVGKRWQTIWMENGKEVSASFDSRDAAELKASQVEVGQSEGTWITKDKLDITLSDMWEIWIASKSGRSKKTIDGYRSAWTHIEPVFGKTPCHKVERAKVTAWLPTLRTTQGCKKGNDRPMGSAQQRKIGIVIKALLEQADELEVIHKNQMRSTDIPRQAKAERRYLTIKEIDALLEAAPHFQIQLLIRVLLFTGIRPGEAKGLRVKDLDPIRGRLMIRRDVDDLGNPDETKTRNHRDVPVGGDLLLDLEDATENRNLEDWLIPDEHGHVWTTARWRRVWADILSTSGINDITTYTLKHTSASLAIAAGSDAKIVQRMLGHSSAAMTLDTYTHLWDEGLDSIPGAIEDHIDAERKREQARERARLERRARRGNLRAVKDSDAV